VLRKQRVRCRIGHPRAEYTIRKNLPIGVPRRCYGDVAVCQARIHVVLTKTLLGNSPSPCIAYLSSPRKPDADILRVTELENIAPYTSTTLSLEGIMRMHLNLHSFTAVHCHKSLIIKPHDKNGLKIYKNTCKPNCNVYRA
jgi:hypothetical protein